MTTSQEGKHRSEDQSLHRSEDQSLHHHNTCCVVVFFSTRKKVFNDMIPFNSCKEACLLNIGQGCLLMVEMYHLGWSLSEESVIMFITPHMFPRQQGSTTCASALIRMIQSMRMREGRGGGDGGGVIGEGVTGEGVMGRG